MMWVWLLTAALLFWQTLYRFKRRKLYKMASRLPLTGLPVLGVTHLISGNSEDIMKQLKHFSYQAMEHDGLLGGWACHVFGLVMVNPVDMEYVLRTCLEKSDYHKFLRDVTGNGGIFAPVPIWRRRRKVMVPAFSPKIVETFVRVFSRQSEKMTGILEGHAHGRPVNMWSFLSSYTFDSVCESTLGVETNAQDSLNTPFLVALNRVLDLVCRRCFQLWLHPDWVYRYLPQYREQQYYTNMMHSFIEKVIQKKREEIKINKTLKADDNENDVENNKTKTFLDHLIQVSGSKGEVGYSDLELREELLTLAVGGTDTSAVVAGFALILFAKYPHMQEEAYQEIYSVFGGHDRLLVKEDLVKLKYLERFVKETLRLFPPVPFTMRNVDHDVTLPSGRELPAGSTLFISIWGAHRDPKYWGPKAEYFDPDRFLPERYNLVHACSFMPFSQGPRNCVGYQYAMMSIKTVLSAILRKYKIVGEVETSPVPKIRVKLDVIMKAVDGYAVALERRF